MNWKDQMTTDAIKTYIDTLDKTTLSESEKMAKFEEMCEKNKIEDLFIRMGFFYFGIKSQIQNQNQVTKLFFN
jgi:hypothetical protein